MAPRFRLPSALPAGWASRTARRSALSGVRRPLLLCARCAWWSKRAFPPVGVCVLGLLDWTLLPSPYGIGSTMLAQADSAIDLQAFTTESIVTLLLIAGLSLVASFFLFGQNQVSSDLSW